MKTFLYSTLLFSLILLSGCGTNTPNNATQTQNRNENPAQTQNTDTQSSPSTITPLSEIEFNDAYTINTQKSAMQWTAGKIVGDPYTGDVRVTLGEIQITDGTWSGNFTIDMTTIDHEKSGVIEHLKSEDFFNVENYPESTFSIANIEMTEGNEILVTGNLTILETTNEITFPAQVTINEDQALTVEAQFDIDRTQWGITYGSGSFFDNLGDGAIRDEISFTLALYFDSL